MCCTRKDQHLPALAAGNANLVIAGTAIDRAVILRQEWYLRLSTALCTNHSVHFSRGALRTRACSASSSSAGSTAGRAATRLIYQPFCWLHLLLTCCEYEVISTFTAL